MFIDQICQKKKAHWLRPDISEYTINNKHYVKFIEIPRVRAFLPHPLLRVLQISSEFDSALVSVFNLVAKDQ